ncbi:MAG: DUF1491 family protein [Pseudobdellovibrionaceae bacterium]
MIEEPRLPTAVWVDAHLRRLNEEGRGYYLVHKGAYAAGVVLVKIAFLNGTCKILTQIRGIDGNLAWMNALSAEVVAESDADAYIRRAVERDPDLWAIEIEDREGRNPFEGSIIL